MALSRELEALQREKGLIIGVGYMLRYSPAVEVGKSWTFFWKLNFKWNLSYDCIWKGDTLAKGTPDAEFVHRHLGMNH